MRFIPAGAGNTLVFVLITRFSTVYPRWRGEHFKLPTGQEIHIGLSPLARGTRALRCIICQTIRFIPAGAGNTPGFGMKSRSGPVYPRWRGEHPLIPCNPGGPHGLSPLARGTRNYKTRT